MRTVTTLPHDTEDITRIWDDVAKKGNCDNWGRQPITMIILHSMDGFVAGSTAWFKSQNTSAHYGIGMDGKITNWVPENYVAYHSGKYAINQQSIGIEHEDNGDNTIVRSPELYATSIKLVADICREYGIPCDRDHIKMHNEIVATSCPGTLAVDGIVVEAAKLLGFAPAPTTPVAPVTMVEVGSDVFTSLVTKSSEYDEVWKTIGLDPSLELKVGSHQVILDYITSKVTEAQNSVPAPVVASPAPASQSVLTKDVGQIVAEFLQFLKIKKV